MIRASRNTKEGYLTDKQFDEIISNCVNRETDFFSNVILPDFVAFCLANRFNTDALWEDSCLEYEYLDIIDTLANLSFLPDYQELNIDKINSILKEKYSLIITSSNPIKIESIK